MTFIRRVTTYGKPDDPFVRIVDEWHADGDIVHHKRTIYPRANADRIAIDVRVEGDRIS